MPVNLHQYRATVGIFNNRFIVSGNFCINLFHRKFFGCFSLPLFILLFLWLYIVCLFPKFFHANCKHIFLYLRLAIYVFMTVLYLRYSWLYSILVKLSGDVEENPGPKPKPRQSFSICHWNVNSVSAYNFSKVSL